MTTGISPLCPLSKQGVSNQNPILWTLTHHIDVIRVYAHENRLTLWRCELEHRPVIHKLLAFPLISVEMLNHPSITHLSEPTRCGRTAIQALTKYLEQFVAVVIVLSQSLLELHRNLFLRRHISIYYSYA